MATLTVHRSLDEAERLAREWESLSTVSPHATPFQTASWSIAWMRAMRVDAPRLLAIRSGRELVGLVPLFAWGCGPVRALSLVGTGVSDRLDVLAAPGFEGATTDGLRQWLEDERGGWSGCTFDEVGPEALLRGVRAPEGSTLAATAQSVCPVLALPDGDRNIDDILSLGQSARLHKARRRASSIGEAAFERADHGRAADGLGDLFALHARRWESRGRPGVLADPCIRALHIEVAPAFDRRGILRLYRMRVGGRLAAVVYGFRWHQRVSLYLSGIEPSLERASPGMLIMAAILADAQAEGAREVDFLRGDEPYKYAWGALDENNVQLRLDPPSVSLLRSP